MAAFKPCCSCIPTMQGLTLPLVQLEMAVASLIEPEMPIKRLLLLLEMARQAAPASPTIPVQHWAQVLRDLSG